MNFTFCRSTAKGPAKAHPDDTGFDIFSTFADFNTDGFLNQNEDICMEDINFYDGNVESITLRPGCRALIPTGIKVHLPPVVHFSPNDDSFIWGLEVRPKSGLALKQGLTVLNTPGTIDNSYTGEIGIIMYNSSNTTPATINHLQKIAQLVPERVYVEQDFTLVDEDEINSLPSTRGENGYGSTGLT